MQEALDLVKSVLHESHWFMVTVRLLLVDQMDAAREWGAAATEASALLQALEPIVPIYHPTVARMLMVCSL